LRGGRKLGDALATTRVLSLTGLNLIRVGERSGELAPMLRTLAMLHENAGRERLKRFLILLEPMAILLIGGVLGTIMIAIMMAITSISTIAI
ncbi:type II secretion system F family protein, partial [Methylomagnum sp.]